MIWHGFPRTLLFGALAGVGWPAAALLLTVAFDARDALAIYLVGVAAIYVAGLGGSPRRALGNGLLALGLGALLLLLAPGMATVALGAALLVGLCRFRLYGEGGRTRAAVVELGTLGLGLALARALAGPSPMAVALAIWAFFVAQSLYFLAPGLRRRHRDVDSIDPFDLAVRRAEALMDGARP